MTETTQQSPLLEMSELFADLPISVCADIVSMARTRDYLCRQVMFLAGGRTKETLLLTDGRAKITQVGESGTEVILRLRSRSRNARYLCGVQRSSREL